MKKIWIGAVAVVALSGTVFGDSIWSGSTGNLSNSIPTTSTFTSQMPAYPNNVSTLNNQAPFWNNPSQDVLSDGHFSNVGDILSGATTGTNLIGSNLVGGIGGNVQGTYYAFNTTDSTSGGGNPINSSAPTTSGSLVSETSSLEYSFSSTATAYNIALLFADSGQNTGADPTVFGTYIGAPGAIILTPLDTVSNNTTGVAQTIDTNDVLYNNPGTVYGFYATVCYAQSAGVCTASVTYTTGAGNYSTNISASGANNYWLGALGWNHFALFELQNGEEVIGFEDSPWAIGTTNAVEGSGDYNDVVFSLTSQGGASAPEPGTIAIMGLGLAMLGSLGRRRFAKK